MLKIKFALKKDMNILKRIETSDKLFLLLMLAKSYTSHLSMEPEKVEQTSQKFVSLTTLADQER